MKTYDSHAGSDPRAARPCALCSSLSFEPLWDLEDCSFVRCPSCGLIQQNPQPLREAVLARYGEDYLAYEAKRQFDYRSLELKALGALAFDGLVSPAWALAIAQGRLPSLLDVGCATGALLEHFRARGWAVTGVETSQAQASYGRETYGLDIRATTLEEAGLPEASFDVVHASQLIEHLNDPAAFLREARRLLSPQGLLFLATPNADGFQARALGGAWRSAIGDHLYLFSVSTLTRLLSDSGFDVLSLITWGGWAQGLKPGFIKPSLDRWAKARGRGDVMALAARPRDGIKGQGHG